MNDILEIQYILQKKYIENHMQEMDMLVNPRLSQQTTKAIIEIKHLLKNMEVEKLNNFENQPFTDAVVTSMQRVENRLDLQSQNQDKMMSLLSVLNTSLYSSSQLSIPRDEEVIEIVQDVSFKMDALSEAFASLPDWIPAHTLTDSTGLGADAIRKQLQNPKFFEPEVDYKRDGKIWLIHKSAIPKVRRLK